MEWLKNFSGSAAVHMDFQVEDDFGTAGVPARLGSTTGDAGLILPDDADTCDDMIGLAVGTAAENTDALLKVIVSPDAVFRVKLTAGATADTALTIGTVGSAGTETTAGIDDMDDLVFTNYEDCAIWGYSGSLVGEVRAIASVTDGDTIVIRNLWPSVPVAGDQFLVAARFPGVLAGITLSSNFTQTDATDENASGAEFVVIDGEFRDVGDEGTSNSYLHVVSTSHALLGSTNHA